MRTATITRKCICDNCGAQADYRPQTITNGVDPRGADVRLPDGWTFFLAKRNRGIFKEMHFCSTQCLIFHLRLAA